MSGTTLFSISKNNYLSRECKSRGESKEWYLSQPFLPSFHRFIITLSFLSSFPKFSVCTIAHFDYEEEILWGEGKEGTIEKKKRREEKSEMNEGKFRTMRNNEERERKKEMKRREGKKWKRGERKKWKGEKERNGKGERQRCWLRCVWCCWEEEPFSFFFLLTSSLSSFSSMNSLESEREIHNVRLKIKLLEREREREEKWGRYQLAPIPELLKNAVLMEREVVLREREKTIFKMNFLEENFSFSFLFYFYQACKKEREEKERRERETQQLSPKADTECYHHHHRKTLFRVSLVATIENWFTGNDAFLLVTFFLSFLCCVFFSISWTLYTTIHFSSPDLEPDLLERGKPSLPSLTHERKEITKPKIVTFIATWTISSPSSTSTLVLPF